MRAAVKGSLQIGARKTRFEATLALKTPGRLRVEISGPIGGTRALLTARQERVLVLFPPTREFIDEEATPATWQAVIGLPLTTAGLIDLFAHAGSRGSRRIPLAGESDDGAGSLEVAYEGDRIHATMGLPQDAGYRALELRVIELERPGADAIPEDLFTPDVPVGWTRVTPRDATSEVPTLLP